MCTGTHNDVRVEGKEHATIVSLLFLACTSIASLTDYNKVAKIAGNQNNFSGVDDYWETYPSALTDTIFPQVETHWRSPHLAVKQLLKGLSPCSSSA